MNNDDASIQERFEVFHAANPWVLDTLIRLADDLVAHNASRVGIKSLWEVMRWQHQRQTKDSSPFKLNNNYHSRYARLIVEQRPDLAPYFQTRKLTAA